MPTYNVELLRWRKVREQSSVDVEAETEAEAQAIAAERDDPDDEFWLVQEITIENSEVGEATLVEPSRLGRA
jgi:hypothetical protein